MTMRRLIVEPRGLTPLSVKLAVPILSVLAALVVAGIFLAVTGENPWDVYTHMVESAFGSRRALSETLISATPLIMTGVAAAIAFLLICRRWPERRPNCRMIRI